MGNVWVTYGDRMGSPYVPHMWPIGFDCSSVRENEVEEDYLKVSVIDGPPRCSTKCLREENA